MEYIKELKRDQQKLHNLEERQTLMNSKRQKLLFRIFVSKYFEKKKSKKALKKSRDENCIFVSEIDVIDISKAFISLIL